MVDDLVPPFEAATAYIVITIAFLVILALWLGWRVSRLDEKPRLAGLRVSTWRRRIDKLHTEHRKHGETRVYSLALAKLLRDFGTERSGINMTTLSSAEIDEASGQPAFAQLLRELEAPSFSPSGEGEIGELTERAKAAVGAW